ncbi:MAG: hypothetical protein JWR13_4053 [Mycobacterium sp.]|jgi:hypothetical protein|nr:hypothetical protein [Mycobacterium sp.]MDT5315157.1 hypothetical protein [Mycobacterium sp.]
MSRNLLDYADLRRRSHYMPSDASVFRMRDNAVTTIRVGPSLAWSPPVTDQSGRHERIKHDGACVRPLCGGQSR